METKRKTCNTPIIEISDSDDEIYNKYRKSLDESFMMEKEKRRKKVQVKDVEPAKKEPAKTGLRSNFVKLTKRKAQEIESPSKNLTKNKKHKPAESSTNLNAEELPTNLDAEESRLEKKTKKGDKYSKLNVNVDVKLNSSFMHCVEWTDVDYISEMNNVDKSVAKNVVKLFEEDNTIPFIARYRKNMIGSMEPDKLRALKDSFDQVKVIKHRAAMIIKTIDKLGKWSPELHSVVTAAKSLADLEHIYSLFKPMSKRSLAERARELGLGSVSDAILQGEKIPPLVSLIDHQKDGLRSKEQVKDGIVHVIADSISKDKEVFEKVAALRKIFAVEIQTVRNKTKSENFTDERKYETYFEFRANEKSVKPHQIMAINRAESRKFISVKIVIPDAFARSFKNFCLSRYALMVTASKLHADLLDKSVDHAYKNQIKRLVTRRVKTEMKNRAESASIEVFATNVKQLLLAPPVRGKVILGIDPGFKHGCKLAVVSEHGDVLDTDVIHPHGSTEASYERSADVMMKLMKKYKCTILALGNATACRETELFLEKMIKSRIFGDLDVTYTIVDESGASTYSCSNVAKSEFPDLDVNLVSAISIARRLQDPLAELVKVEPKHLGVGMYQHDLPEKQLMNALDEVVSEAVSFVGVDVNTASQCLLRRVAGLTNSRAANIIEWRTKHGAFTNREQLLSVKGIGSKTFEQCAGFIRISPKTATFERRAKSGKSKNLRNTFNPLDQTWIHPESYSIANDFVKYCQCDLNDLGTSKFIEKISSCAKEGCAKLAARFCTNEEMMEVIVKSLTMSKDEDIRLKSSRPLFRDGIRKIEDLSIGVVLDGVVRNVTHFGAFVDVGVGRDGLIHVSRLKNLVLCVGQCVEVRVLSVERIRDRISLELTKIL